MGKWKEYQNRFPTEAEWEGWKFADAICIVVGKISGNLLMIDFDQRGKALPDFKEKIDPELYSRLIIEQSQSGGFHIIFRSESPVPGNIELAKDDNGKILIETRGEGGIFLCAPTLGYEVMQGDFSSIPVLSSEEVETLLNAAWSLNQFKKPEPPPRSPPKSHTPKPTAVQSGKTPIDDFNNSERGRQEFKELLQRHGWQYVKEDTTNEFWLRPGKDIRTKQHSATSIPANTVCVTPSLS